MGERTFVGKVEKPGGTGVSRRRFMGYLIAAPTLVAGAQLAADPAKGAVPTHQPVDLYDLSDLEIPVVVLEPSATR